MHRTDHSVRSGSRDFPDVEINSKGNVRYCRREPVNINFDSYPRGSLWGHVGDSLLVKTGPGHVGVGVKGTGRHGWSYYRGKEIPTRNSTSEIHCFTDHI